MPKDREPALPHIEHNLPDPEGALPPVEPEDLPDPEDFVLNDDPQPDPKE